MQFRIHNRTLSWNQTFLSETNELDNKQYDYTAENNQYAGTKEMSMSVCVPNVIQLLCMNICHDWSPSLLLTSKSLSLVSEHIVKLLKQGLAFECFLYDNEFLGFWIIQKNLMTVQVPELQVRRRNKLKAIREKKECTTCAETNQLQALTFYWQTLAYHIPVTDNECLVSESEARKQSHINRTRNPYWKSE